MDKKNKKSIMYKLIIIYKYNKVYAIEYLI